MKNNRGSIFWIILVVNLVLFFSVGCSKLATVFKSDSDQIKDRSLARWEALIEKKWEVAYTFELPAYRLTHDINQYRTKFGHSVQWKSISFESLKLDNEAKLADVNLKLSYQVIMSDGGQIENDKILNERWMKQEDEWWLVNSE